MKKLQHFWHVVSNVRPIYWISLYVLLIPLFAFFYWLLPAGEFRIPDGGSEGYGGWLYYSIVTLTTLGFGDYTPAMPGAQWLTAVEVLCGLLTIGFFLNAVGSMKSEIDVESELEKQRLVHSRTETEKLIKNMPVCFHKLNEFLEYCYAVTTPIAKRAEQHEYNDQFTADDMADMNKPSGLPDDRSNRSAVQSLMRSADTTCLFLDSLQQRVDLSLWPTLLEDCFAFVANYQMLSPIPEDQHELSEKGELEHFIRTNATLARNIETQLTQISTAKPSEAIVH